MAYERAVLAGGCFWGMQDLIRRQEGFRDPSRLYRRRRSERDLPQSRQPTRRPSKSPTIRHVRASAGSSSSSSRFMIQQPRTARATTVA